MKSRKLLCGIFPQTRQHSICCRKKAHFLLGEIHFLLGEFQFLLGEIQFLLGEFQFFFKKISTVAGDILAVVGNKMIAEEGRSTAYVIARPYKRFKR
jgi:hypothetical protein